MQAFKSSAGISTMAGLKDEKLIPRTTRLVRIEFESRVGGIILDGGHVVSGPGEHWAEVRADQVDYIREHMVVSDKDRQDMERAAEDYAIEADNAYSQDRRVPIQLVRDAREKSEALADYEQRAAEGKLLPDEPEPPRLTTEESKLMADRETFLSEEIGYVSWERSLSRRNPFGAKPLLWLRVVGDDIALPSEQEAAQHLAQQSTAITQAVMAAMGGVEAMVEKRLAQLESTFDERVKAAAREMNAQATTEGASKKK